VVLYEGWHQSQNKAERLKTLAQDPRRGVGELLSTHKRIEILDADPERASEVLTNKIAGSVIQPRDAVAGEIGSKHEAFRFFRRLVNFAPHKADAPLKYDAHLDYFACDSTLECHRDHLRLDDNLCPGPHSKGTTGADVRAPACEAQIPAQRLASPHPPFGFSGKIGCPQVISTREPSQRLNR
jgi:hypothetical protein